VARRYKRLSPQVFEKIVKSEVEPIVEKLIHRFDEEIVPYEDEEDPARPSLCREEFKQFLRETIESNIKIRGNFVEIGVGDDQKLGFGEELDEETTDCVRIIGTIIQGISGDYVLVTSQMTGEPEGRFGRAFIMPVEQYVNEAWSKGWDPDRPIWKFSNFPGIPDFFAGLELSDVAGRIARKLGEEIKKL
jgi:hypothetical protein